jgi:hypothetical protein
MFTPPDLRRTTSPIAKPMRAVPDADPGSMASPGYVSTLHRTRYNSN